MSTSNLVQDLTAGRATDVSARREVRAFVAGGAITAGDFVAFKTNETADGDKALKVIRAVTGGSPTAGAIGPAAHPVGIAVSTAASGELVNICVSGIAEANVDSATAIGSLLCSGVTAGRADVYEAAFLCVPVAIAIEADTSNVSTVIMLKQV
jgi:hypothetical protein